MLVSVNQVETGLAAYMDKEFASKFPDNSIEKAIICFATARAIRRYGQKIISLRNSEIDKLIGIFDVDGNVDADSLRDDLKMAIPEGGVKKELPYIGTVTIKREDVDVLYRYITE